MRPRPGRQLAFERLGYDPADASTWPEARVHLPGMNTVEVREAAPGVAQGRRLLPPLPRQPRAGAALRALGVTSLDFRITGERERIVPERLHRQQQMPDEQKARLGIA